jgi:hypothetical protein
MIAAIVGAGPLGTALASTLAARGRVRHVRLIDEAGTVAAGKALDVRQSTPVIGHDVSIEASADVERGVAELGLPWTRILGSAPIAFAAAGRTLVAEAAGTAPAAVDLALGGLPPSQLVIGWSASSVDGAPAESRIAPQDMAGITRRLVASWPPAPFALAAAAALLLEAIDEAGSARLAAIVAPPSRGGRAALAAVRVGPSGVLDAAEPSLSPFERIALDNAIAARR